MSQSTFSLLLYVAGIVGVLLLFLWSTYNRIITRLNHVKTDFSDVNIQISRKAALIQNLVDLVKQYAKHEQETFTQVAKARSAADNSKTAADSAKAENMLTQTLRSLFMVVENYPQLQASNNYKDLREDILKTEDLIAKYREEYNESVRRYNTLIQTFPNLFAAKLFAFSEAQLFQTSDSTK